MTSDAARWRKPVLSVSGHLCSIVKGSALHAWLVHEGGGKYCLDWQGESTKMEVEMHYKCAVSCAPVL